jgi:hypothetical protein
MDIESFWKDVLSQNRGSLPGYFHKDAVIRWHCSNELFTVSEYIKANCEYPGQWAGEIERIEEKDDLIITAVRVFPKDNNSSFHVVSFCKIKGGLIVEMDEYWSNDGLAPEWRRRMSIGKPIR